MNKSTLKKFFSNFIILIIIFLIDRVSKLYILKLAEVENKVDIYVTSYLNLFLIWNKGVAFGLLSVDESLLYNVVTAIIVIIVLIILIMITRSEGLEKYALSCVFGGAIGNLFDRFYYSAVPDFIDFHIAGFHWFIFNIADIFITLGVICLIYVEIFTHKIKNEK
jgi:signal peptidase II